MRKALSMLIVFSALFSLAACGTGTVNSESPSSSEQSIVSDSASSEHETSEYSPSHGKIDPKAINLSLKYISGSDPVTYKGESFDFSSPLAESIMTGGNVSQSDGCIVMENSSSLKIKPGSPFSAERMIIGFTIRFVELAPTADSAFSDSDDLLTFSFSEKGRWYDSSNPYSVRFRIRKSNKSLRFYGYTDSVSNEQLVRTEKNVTDFEAYQEFRVKLIFDHDRCYITVNDGSISYHCPVDTMTDFMIRVRNGVRVSISELNYYGTKSPEYKIGGTLEELIDAGCFTGYVNVRAREEGVYFERLCHEQYMGSEFMPLAASDSGVTLDLITDSRQVEIAFRVTDSIWATGWNSVFDVYLNGEFNKRISRTVAKNDIVRVLYTVPSGKEGNNRLTFWFPSCLSLSLLSLRLCDGASFEAVAHEKKLLMLGDSITEGNSVENPSDLYSSVVARSYGFTVLNQAVSGSIFSDFAVSGSYDGFTPDCVLIAYGTNNYGDGSADFAYVKTLIRDGMRSMITSLRERFPDAKIIGLLPLCRTGEEGTNFTLSETSKYISECYDEFGIEYIDCHDMLPLEQKYFSDTMLHPNSTGSRLFGENLAKALKNIVK